MNNGPIKVVVFANTGIEIVKPLYDAGINIVGVIESKDRHTITNPIKKILTNINRFITGRDRAQSLREFADSKKIPYLTYKDKQPEDVADWIKSLSAELLVSHQAPILPEVVFTAATFGSINLHPTLLPKYRGSNPFFWMYYHKDMTAGITIHKIDHDIDTGGILVQRSCSVDYGTSAEQLERDIVKHLAVPALIELITDFNPNLPTIEQPEDSPTPYARRMEDAEYRDLILTKGFNIKQFWHLLHANQQWKTALIGQLYDNAYDWQIGQYETSEHDHPFGKLILDKKKVGIAHPEGVVWFERRFNLNRFIANRVLN